MTITLKDVQDALETIVAGAGENITEDTNVSDLPIDSLDTFQVYAELEEKTDKVMSDEAYDEVKTVEDIIAYFNS